MNEEQEWVRGDVTLRIDGKPLELSMTVPAKPTTIRRMLPVFQQMSDSFVELAIGNVESVGRTVSCKAGCGACCRQAVPLSVPEAFDIASLVEDMPEEKKKKIRERFEAGIKKLAEAGWFQRLDLAPTLDDRERELIIEDYFKMGIPCPFLENESCSIHSDRPLACREYLVTSPAERCKEPFSGGVDGITLAVKPSTTLNRISRGADNGPDVGFVPLIVALKWAEASEEDDAKKTGEQWMADFFTNLTNDKIPGFEGQ